MWILQWLPFWIFYAILFVGIIGFATTYLLRFIPIPAVYMYKTPIQLVSILFIVIGVTKTQVVRERGNDIVRYVDREVVKYDSKCEVPKEAVSAVNQAAEGVKK